MKLLNNTTIIDFTRLLPGPLATNMLAQMGAKVIKIEHPKRLDYARHTGADLDGASLFFRMLNHQKEQRTIDYQNLEGQAEVIALIKNADVLIEQFRPGAMSSWGLGYKTLHKINPTLVYVSLTGYGQTGPWATTAGHDLNYLATSGILSLLKDDAGKPVVPGFQLADIGGGAYSSVMACLAGLLYSRNNNTGQHIDVSMTDAMLPLLTFPISLLWSGLDPDVMNILNGKTVANYAVYECADGKWLSVAALEIKFWNNICALVNKAAWQRQHPLELSNKLFPKGAVIDLFKSKNRAEWLTIFEGHDVCIAPVLELNELTQQAQLKARQLFIQLQTQTGKTFNAFGLPFKLVVNN